jgi:galactokinase
MKASQLKLKIQEGALTRYPELYSDESRQCDRFIGMIDGFMSLWGDDEVMLLSVPGRSEISGNHTDHNRGCVLAGAIDRDVIAVACRNGDGVVRFFSEGYPMSEVRISDTNDKDNFENYTSSAIIAGMIDGFIKKGYAVGGMNVYSTSDVLKGSGISSSAAYEVMIGNALNHLYNDGNVKNEEIAKLAQYAENVYFGKPCGLMDQMACAVGGFVYIDFANKDDPEVVPIDFALSEQGYALCIVNTGGNHADLNEDYASVPREMKDVAKELGQDVLRGISEDELIKNIPALRESVGDRAVLRALHFVRENERVRRARKALTEGKICDFFAAVNESGASSFKYLQNVYTTHNVAEQGISLALALAEGYLGGEGASRVHGGGFAGTVQVFVKKERLAGLCALMDSVFGEGSAVAFNVRPKGAVKLELI